VGSFKNGKKHGSGVIYYIDGTIEEGKWENDVLISSELDMDDSVREEETQE
jgi:antitoxin component YwqK of YwqJK toxin-antitoxin module